MSYPLPCPWSYVRHLGNKTDHWDGKLLNKKRKKGREAMFPLCLLAICQSAMETIAVGFGSNRGLQEFDWSTLITQLPNSFNPALFLAQIMCVLNKATGR